MDRATIIALIALCGVVVLAARGRRETRAGAHSEQQVTLPPGAPAPTAPVEVAHQMNRIQAYAEKLWWAGEAGNLPLAKFYRHELKEEMEVVAAAGIEEDGIRVSENMQVYGIRSIDAMKELLATSGLKDFRTGYDGLILSCNSCHMASGHAEIVVRIPTENRFTGQVFTPAP
jgi:hypothetical protein